MLAKIETNHTKLVSLWYSLKILLNHRIIIQLKNNAYNFYRIHLDTLLYNYLYAIRTQDVENEGKSIEYVRDRYRFLWTSKMNDAPPTYSFVGAFRIGIDTPYVDSAVVNHHTD